MEKQCKELQSGSQSFDRAESSSRGLKNEGDERILTFLSLRDFSLPLSGQPCASDRRISSWFYPNASGRGSSQPGLGQRAKKNTLVLASLPGSLWSVVSQSAFHPYSVCGGVTAIHKSCRNCQKGSKTTPAPPPSDLRFKTSGNQLNPTM